CAPSCTRASRWCARVDAHACRCVGGSAREWCASADLTAPQCFVCRRLKSETLDRIDRIFLVNSQCLSFNYLAIFVFTFPARGLSWPFLRARSSIWFCLVPLTIAGSYRIRRSLATSGLLMRSTRRKQSICSLLLTGYRQPDRLRCRSPIRSGSCKYLMRPARNLRLLICKALSLPGYIS